MDALLLRITRYGLAYNLHDNRHNHRPLPRPGVEVEQHHLLVLAGEELVPGEGDGQARADEGRAPIAVEECDLRELVNEATETAQILAEAKEIAVSATIPETPVLVRVDRSRVRQLLLNLVTNAVKYTGRRGEVGLELDDQGSTVHLVVRDTGIGIAAGDLPHIFDRFWRADPARSRDADRAGTGLGLAITKWVAEAHGGSIAVQSRPGRGTTFTVSLPRSPNSAATSVG